MKISAFVGILNTCFKGILKFMDVQIEIQNKLIIEQYSNSYIHIFLNCQSLPT